VKRNSGAKVETAARRPAIQPRLAQVERVRLCSVGAHPTADLIVRHAMEWEKILISRRIKTEIENLIALFFSSLQEPLHCGQGGLTTPYSHNGFAQAFSCSL
jgi:hypothetical protein